MSSVALLTSLATANASAACTSSTLNGSWGFHYSGIDFANQRFCAGVGLIQFTPSNLSVTVPSTKESCDGTPLSRTAKGSYSVASNCTATVSLTDNSGRKGSYSLVITSSGTKADFMLVFAGSTLTGTLTKL